MVAWSQSSESQSQDLSRPVFRDANAYANPSVRSRPEATLGVTTDPLEPAPDERFRHLAT